MGIQTFSNDRSIVRIFSLITDSMEEIRIKDILHLQGILMVILEEAMQVMAEECSMGITKHSVESARRAHHVRLEMTVPVM